MNQVYKTLPDDRPITSLIVVEDIEKCPEGYIPVSKTHNQDSDADLWRESGFFGRKCTRYLCMSKTKGFQNYVIQSLSIIGEKETPPQGFKTIPKTLDTEQKAWRKKQLCYKFSLLSTCETAITDIIVLSRIKKAPEEFTLLGEINGMTLCYKVSKGTVAKNSSFYPPVPYLVLPFKKENSNPNNPEEGLCQPNHPEINSFVKPENNINEKNIFRPAPKPPAFSYGTISGYNGLEGVPFILNPKYNFSRTINKDFTFPKIKTRSQIEEEYSYEFRIERETL